MGTLLNTFEKPLNVSQIEQLLNKKKRMGTLLNTFEKPLNVSDSRFVLLCISLQPETQSN